MSATLFYEKSGQGDPIILLHGNGETHQIFDKAVLLLKDYYTVYALDSRGHGKSGNPKEELFYEDMVEDVESFIIDMNIQKPIIYGFSDGGIVALMLAMKQPDLLSKLVVSGVNINPEGIRRNWLILFKLIYAFSKSKNYKMMLTQPQIDPKELGKITIPVYVTAGSRDLIRMDHMEMIAEHIQNSCFKVFDKENHASYVIHSDTIAKYILNIMKC